MTKKTATPAKITQPTTVEEVTTAVVAVKEKLFNLRDRWMDEREYEDFADYMKVITKMLPFIETGSSDFSFTALNGTVKIKIGKALSIMTKAPASPKQKLAKALKAAKTPTEAANAINMHESSAVAAFKAKAAAAKKTGGHVMAAPPPPPSNTAKKVVGTLIEVAPPTSFKTDAKGKVTPVFEKKPTVASKLAAKADAKNIEKNAGKVHGFEEFKEEDGIASTLIARGFTLTRTTSAAKRKMLGYEHKDGRVVAYSTKMDGSDGRWIFKDNNGITHQGDALVPLDLLLKKNERPASKAAAKRAVKANIKAAMAVTEGQRSVSRKILPGKKKMSKSERKEHDAKVIREVRLQAEAKALENIAVPKADVQVHLVPSDIVLLEDPSNGLSILQLEKTNSQGAVCVYNNGVRVAAGVIPPEILKTLRPVANADLAKAANQLLTPLVPSVIVTPVAQRHLTAVLNCKELIAMAVAKKAKFAAPSTKSVKAVAAKKTAAAKAEKPAAKAAKNGSEKKGRTALYRLLNDTKSTWSEFKGQKATVIDALVKAGAVGKNAKGITSSELYKKLEGKLETNSTVERIAGFYLSTWQRDEILEKYDPS